jgi:hypothetical protein
MVDLCGHEAGNGGYSQGTPTAHRPLSYSDRRHVGNDSQSTRKAVSRELAQQLDTVLSYRLSVCAAGASLADDSCRGVE